MNEPVKYYTAAEVAAHMRVSKMTVYRLIHAQVMPAIRVGRSFRIPARGLSAYVRDHQSEYDIH